MIKNYFVYPLRVHIEDTDFGGVVYHSNYLNFMERARSEWFDELGVGINWQRQQGILFAVHSAKLDFLKPARLHDQVEVVTTITKIGKASIYFLQHLRQKDMPDRIFFKAEIKLACVDTAMRPKLLPKLPFLLQQI